MFDLINFNVGGNSNGRPFSGTVSSVNPSARKVNSPRNSARSKEAKAAEALVKSLDTLDYYDAPAFAYFFAQAGPVINVRMFKIFEELLKVWADRADSEMTNSDAEYNIAIEAKRILDSYRNTYRQE